MATHPVVTPLVAPSSSSAIAPDPDKHVHNPSDVDRLRTAVGLDLLPNYVDRQAEEAVQHALQRWARLVAYAEARSPAQTPSSRQAAA
ncbi:hypothetical protein [Pandoraea terrae]|nr:hypothetical protein [Pandoraea terrae]